MANTRRCKDISEQHQNTNKIKRRKHIIQEAIKKNSFKIENPIAGYNLSAYKKKRKKINILCWTSGKIGHTNVS